MILKNTVAIAVCIESDGKICITQYHQELCEYVDVYLTPEQFKSIENWVFKNRDEIELAWNDGVEHEANS